MEKAGSKAEELDFVSTERKLDIGYENWKNNLVMLDKAGLIDKDKEEFQDLLSDLEQAVEDVDEEKADKISSILKEKVKTEMMT